MLDPVTEPEVTEEGESLRGFPKENRFADSPASSNAPQELVKEDLLIEDVSIDGMCGVY